jgi:uncharacterized membrane protein YbaN (DUF454 family)
MRRAFWNMVGFVSLAIGLLGAVLPLLPATPFMLLAAFAFGQGSPRFRHWIVTHPTFGPAVTRWEAHGAINRRHKWLGCGGMALSLVASLAFGVPMTVLAIQAACLAGAATFILSRPDGPPSG